MSWGNILGGLIQSIASIPAQLIGGAAQAIGRALGHQPSLTPQQRQEAAQAVSGVFGGLGQLAHAAQQEMAQYPTTEAQYAEALKQWPASIQPPAPPPQPGSTVRPGDYAKTYSTWSVTKQSDGSGYSSPYAIWNTLDPSKASLQDPMAKIPGSFVGSESPVTLREYVEHPSMQQYRFTVYPGTKIGNATIEYGIKEPHGMGVFLVGKERVGDQEETRIFHQGGLWYDTSGRPLFASQAEFQERFGLEKVQPSDYFGPVWKPVGVSGLAVHTDIRDVLRGAGAPEYVASAGIPYYLEGHGIPVVVAPDQTVTFLSPELTQVQWEEVPPAEEGGQPTYRVTRVVLPKLPEGSYIRYVQSPEELPPEYAKYWGGGLAGTAIAPPLPNVPAITEVTPTTVLPETGMTDLAEALNMALGWRSSGLAGNLFGPASGDYSWASLLVPWLVAQATRPKEEEKEKPYPGNVQPTLESIRMGIL